MSTGENLGMRALADQYGVAPKKSWGQNFLSDGNIQRKIVDAGAITSDDPVLEIGAGMGALTRHALDQARWVFAVERDRDLIKVLNGRFADAANLEVVEADAQQLDWKRFRERAGSPLVVLGNLPYQISSTLLFGIIDAARQHQAVTRAVLMTQKEFADRLAAPPGSRTYGRLSVMAQQWVAPKVLFQVPASCFFPRPAVTSTVFRLDVRSAPLAPVDDWPLFEKVVAKGFEQRRKMLKKGLLSAVPDASRVRSAMAAADIRETARAEEVSVPQFAALTNALSRSV